MLKDQTDIVGWLALAAVALALSAAVGCRTRSSTSPPTPAVKRTEPVATPMPLNDAQRSLAEAFIAAVNAKDADAIRNLLVPEALACYNTPDTKAYLDHWLHTQMRLFIPPVHKLKFVPYERGFQPSRLFTVPVQPMERMEIEFEIKPGSSTTLSSLVNEEKGRYYLFLPCVTDAGVQNFKTEQAKHERALKKAQDVYRQLHGPLRAYLESLAKKGRTPAALEECKKKLGIDFRTAGYLLDLLAGRKPEEER